MKKCENEHIVQGRYDSDDFPRGNSLNSYYKENGQNKIILSGMNVDHLSTFKIHATLGRSLIE